MRKSTSRLRAELSQKSGHQFQNTFAALLDDTRGGIAQSKNLGQLDRLGIDAFAIGTDEKSIEVVVQCKGFEMPEYGASQQSQCRKEIQKYATSGLPTTEYWLVINRPIKERAFRSELEADLAGLVSSGLVTVTRLLDQELAIALLQGLANSCMIGWADAKRDELFTYYAERLEFVSYINEVPFHGPTDAVDPSAFCQARLRTFFDALPRDTTGKFRRAPRLMVTSEFGFGKTSALQAVARAWISAGGHAIYAPAALLEKSNAFATSSNLADCLLDFLIPDDVVLSDLAHHLFRDTLKGTLAVSKDWILILDGLDESSVVLRPNLLASLLGSVADLGVPTILSARDELVEPRKTEFFLEQAFGTPPLFDRLNLREWPNSLILEFLKRFNSMRGGNMPPNFRELWDVVTSGKYEEVYGDIPKRPLFLGMLAQDAWDGQEPARQIHRLYGQYFRRKFLLDRRNVGARGVARRPSAITDALGLDEAVERLIVIMQDVARQMHVTGTESRDVFEESKVREIAAARGLVSVQLEDVMMHSLLQPAGRDNKTRERLVRFAHKSFQEWFLARSCASEGEADAKVSDAAKRFLDAMLADVVSGQALP